MWDIINILYREYCLARLTEMRRYELSNWQSPRWNGRKGYYGGRVTMAPGPRSSPATDRSQSQPS